MLLVPSSSISSVLFSVYDWLRDDEKWNLTFDIRISTDKNPWKFSNFSYRKFFKFYKFHFPWMQFFTCTITILYTAEKQLFEIHNDVVPFLLFYSKTCCMCQIVLFYSTFGWKRLKTIFSCFHFQKTNFCQIWHELH